MKPMISVIMPIFNAEERMETSIDSILNQTFPDFELILINDGSKDSSAEICKKYAEKDKRIVVIHQANQGVSSARNKGLEIAKGRYINFVDADDTIEPNTYDLLMQSVHVFDYDMVIYGMFFDYYKNDLLTHNKTMTVRDNKELKKDNLKKDFFNLYTNNYLTPIWNKLFKKSIIKENKIKFDSEMAILEDLKFSLDSIDYVENILVITNPLYHYYNDTEVLSFTRRPNIDYMENFKILDKRLRKTADEIGLKSKESIGKINSIIIRSYIIHLEYIFKSDLPWNEKYKKTKEFVNKKNIESASQKAKIQRTGLKLTNYLIKKKCAKSLFLLFTIRSILQ